MAKILVVYYSKQYPIRQNTVDHCNCFRHHGGHWAFYLNAALFARPRCLRWIDFDLIIFETTFCGVHWFREEFIGLTESFRYLAQVNSIRAVIPQDEFVNTDILCEFINALDIHYVFSVAPQSEWSTIYNTVNREKVKFYRVLTGYLEDTTVARINQIAKSAPDRSIDLGYRAAAYPWFGRHGMKKLWLGEIFSEKAANCGLNADIFSGQKTERERLIGDDWYRFLLKCKYTLGIEGGTSILDRDGAIWGKTEEYLNTKPDAGFEEIESNCFPNIDGKFGLVCIGPRHIEACATRTAQILVEGDYSGVLEPGRHYISLEKDLGNLDEVIERIKSNHDEKELTERAYQDIVESRRYSYEKFVNFVINMTLSSRLEPGNGVPSLTDRFLYYLMLITDTFSLHGIALYRINQAYFRRIRSILDKAVRRLGRRREVE